MFFFTAMMLANALIARPAETTPVIDPLAENSACPETPMSVARKMGKEPMRAIPLTELPGAQVFMAVDRRVDGCPMPLTAGEYRRAR